MASAGDILTEFKVATGYSFTPSGTEKVMITVYGNKAGGLGKILLLRIYCQH
mgnify:CR=1 FL=1